MLLTWCEINLKNLILLLISLFITFIFFVLGRFFSTENGAFIFPLVGAFITLLIILFADKILLVFFPIQKTDLPEWAIGFIKNTTYKFGIKKILILFTQGKNIYTLDNFIASPRIIIGQNFIEFFSRDECEALIYASFLRIKNKDSRFRTYSSILINIFFLPFLKISPGNIKISFLSLHYVIRSYFFRNKIELMAFDKNLGIHRIPFASALFKLNMQNDEESFLIEDCAIFDNKTSEIAQHIFDFGYDFDARYKDLLREDGKA